MSTSLNWSQRIETIRANVGLPSFQEGRDVYIKRRRIPTG